jgi:antimicrobial peptide system SdpA family protein
MKTKIFFAASTLFFALVLWFIFFNTMDYNLTSIESDNRAFVAKVLPEGWAFFTKDPREEMVDIYQLEENSWKPVSLKNSDPKNIFGISRKSRKMGMEISMICEQVMADSLWTSQVNLGQISFPAKYVRVDNKNLVLLRAGEYALVKRAPVPWSWRHLINNKNARYAIIRVKPVQITPAI